MTTTLTTQERAAAQAYIRLMETAQAVLSDPELAPMAGVYLSSPMAEADEALGRAGLTGNEARLLRLVTALRSPGGAAPA
ncbi:hypothetical protein AMK26_19310 [Streptomyces sp. CB03234]|uniref:hypothetical protein n=1 Tax=Streptomyces sp. (strain CB03234) TaxID=1703937 RepID=UPI00093D209D|nr:hypothetical protein [Streptomyces sp. CB03234]OKK03606.1 hypothetical protein AMK26_19310 [Streptomyces sp. CB03234]